jgi:guanylate kinase
LTAKGYEVFSIFVVPPSEEVLKERLLKRWEDPNSQDFKIRLRESLNWLQLKDIFDYVLVNDDLERAVKEFKTILSLIV